MTICRGIDSIFVVQLELSAPETASSNSSRVHHLPTIVWGRGWSESLLYGSKQMISESQSCHDALLMSSSGFRGHCLELRWLYVGAAGFTLLPLFER